MTIQHSSKLNKMKQTEKCCNTTGLMSLRTSRLPKAPKSYILQSNQQSDHHKDSKSVSEQSLSPILLRKFCTIQDESNLLPATIKTQFNNNRNKHQGIIRSQISSSSSSQVQRKKSTSTSSNSIETSCTARLMNAKPIMMTVTSVSRHGSKESRQIWSNVSLAPMLALALMIFALLVVTPRAIEARITFEKMTNRDYSGLNYYTIQNVSLFECLGWCKEESSCTSAVFSFVVNPFAALQETTCMLQNETQARQGAYLRSTANGEQLTVVAQPQKATNLYFFNKIELQTESVCSRLWAFERFPNKRLRQQRNSSGGGNAMLLGSGGAFHSPSKEACQAACMNEARFVCRSLEYNYINQQCVLSAHDRRSPLVQHLASQVVNVGSGGQHHQLDMIDSPGTDYFENACLLGEDICNESRIYDYAKVGLPLQRVAHFVELNYYPDKEMLVKSQAGCVRACTIEHEFICRSILYRSTFKQGQPNCALYHLDQRTFPEGADAFMAQTLQPLLDSGDTSAVYLEAVCNDTIASSSSLSSSTMAMINTSTQSSLMASSASSSSSSSSSQGSTITMPPASITILPSSTTPGGLSIFPNNNNNNNHSTSSGDLERFISGNGPTSTLAPLGPPTTIRLPSSFLPSSVSSSSSSSGLPSGSGSTVPNNIQISDLPAPGNSRLPSHITISPGSNSNNHGSSQHIRQPLVVGGQGGQIPTHITISPPPGRDTSSLSIEPGNSGLQISTSNGGGGHHLGNHDQNCDAHGFCYDVALKCTDTKMVVNVKTQRPFFGRIYALGRSETCNANIKNQNQFQLDMWLSGQECNTQSAHHNVVLTKADKVYHVRCTYETASRNVTFGMMPVKDMFEVDVNDRNQETISITASSDAPLPKISILTLDGKEASTVRIGDRLTFRIEIPDNTPYGIFARSCIAMAKDARSTFEIIDEHGCPVDHTIFPNFQPASNGNALESNYEAFRFTESYGVIFQCNVKYCIGKCEPVNCGIGNGRDSVESWGRKKRSIGEAAKKANRDGKQVGDDMTLSREIVVLDLKDKSSSDNSGSQSQQQQSATSGDGFEESLLAADGTGAAQKLKRTMVSSRFAAASGRSSPSSSDGDEEAYRSQNAKNEDQKDERSLVSNDANLHCLSSQSLLLLICSIAIFFVLYVCLVAYFFACRDPKISVIKHQYH